MYELMNSGEEEMVVRPDESRELFPEGLFVSTDCLERSCGGRVEQRPSTATAICPCLYSVLYEAMTSASLDGLEWDQNWYEAGFDSFEVLIVSAECQRLGVNLDVSKLLQHPSGLGCVAAVQSK